MENSLHSSYNEISIRRWKTLRAVITRWKLMPVRFDEGEVDLLARIASRAISEREPRRREKVAKLYLKFDRNIMERTYTSNEGGTARKPEAVLGCEGHQQSTPPRKHCRCAFRGLRDQGQGAAGAPRARKQCWLRSGLSPRVPTVRPREWKHKLVAAVQKVSELRQKDAENHRARTAFHG